MTVTATYMGDLSRVRVAFTGAPVIADFATIERSTDGLNWTTIRGGDVVPLTPGFLDDYEFAAGVPNTYRVSFVDSGPIVSAVAPGAAATGDNTSLTPALPSGWAEGDGLLLAASIRATAATIATPAGWTRVLDRGNVVLFGKRATAAETAPMVAFAGGAAGADTIAQINAWKNLDISPVTTNTVANAAAQNIGLPSLTVPGTNMLNLWLAWKQAGWTSVTDPAGFAVIGSTSSAAGTGAGLWWTYTVQGTTQIDFTPRTLTVAGGSAAVSTGMSLAFSAAPYVTRQSATITPVLDQAWLKNPRRPSLNTPVTITEVGDITRQARSGTFDVIGRTMPVVVSDVMSSRSLPITIMAGDLDAADELETRLAAGDPVFLQAPEAASAVPTLYATVRQLTASKSSHRGRRRFYALDLTEVAAPASTVYGATITYADLPGLYATYDAMAAAVSSYFNLMDLVATTSVIVP
ncbi:hypothetical protein [Amycolatopsis sp. NBC_01480]|uniref:hypothetical protein n=1 Tax=Amycolatopsis sp. NBC_01480 TaxID=2903562 RepID=UPI002E2E3879|nr:hypothetical protein [Amycolatopsis sp. NBC_01480]